MAKMAIIITDVSNDFFHPDGSLSKGAGELSPIGVEVVPNIVHLVKAARGKGVPIIYCGDSLPEKCPDLTIWPPHCKKGSWGARPIDEIGELDVIIEKVGFQPMWGESGKQIVEALRKFKVDTVILCGICVTAEIVNMAFVLAIEQFLIDPKDPELSYKIIIPRDCVKGCFCQEEVGHTLQDIKRLIKEKLEITTAYELARRLE